MLVTFKSIRSRQENIVAGIFRVIQSRLCPQPVRRRRSPVRIVRRSSNSRLWRQDRWSIAQSVGRLSGSAKRSQFKIQSPRSKLSEPETTKRRQEIGDPPRRRAFLAPCHRHHLRRRPHAVLSTQLQARVPNSLIASSRQRPDLLRIRHSNLQNPAPIRSSIPICSHLHRRWRNRSRRK